jgi:hypothetical protein
MTDLDWLEEIKADSEKLKALPKDEQVRALTKLAEEQLALQTVIKEIEQTLEKRKERFRQVSEGLLPDLMNELGVATLTLTNGLKVKDSQFIDARITDPAAYDWLEANDNAEIVKMTMSFAVRRTDKRRLQPLVDLAAQMDVEINFKEAVHHMTLKSFVGEALKNGMEIPLELFNVYVGHRVTIT